VILIEKVFKNKTSKKSMIVFLKSKITSYFLKKLINVLLDFAKILAIVVIRKLGYNFFYLKFIFQLIFNLKYLEKHIMHLDKSINGLKNLKIISQLKINPK
jgi:hypothetical protein